MYAPDITTRAIASASAAQGWDLTPHSTADIHSAISHFNDLILDNGALRRPLTEDETRFIQNERRLCALDFRYWSQQYASILNWARQPVAFTPNIAQSMILDVWAEHERQAIAIILMHLKARQLGVSTLYELAVTHRFQFHSHTNAIVASADPKKTVEMGQMMKFCLEQQPWWMLPSSADDKIEKGLIVEFAAIHTRLSIQAGNQFHGVARGATPNVGHLTELSSWQNAEEDVDSSFIRAVHETPDVFVGLESTALGRDNWWATTWDLVKVDWPRGRSRIRGEFLPWFVGTDIYPTPTDLRARPVPPDWTPADRTIHHAERARSYVLANPLLFQYLARGDRDWQMPLAQMWFYEVERDTAIRKKILNKFLAEMPADDHEAFQNTGVSVVDQDIVMSYRERTRHPIGVYAIIGDGIHPSLMPPRHLWLTGPSDPPIITIHAAAVCKSIEVYQFVPLRFDGYPGYDAEFKLFLYEYPEDGETYGLGIDTSDGIGLDWSVIEGARKHTLTAPWGQTCEFASPYIKADQLWPMALALGCFYSTYNAKAQRRTQCRLAIECRGNGEIVQSQLKNRGWMNFHPWKYYDKRHRIADAEVATEGVFTNSPFRAALMDKMLTLVDEDGIDLASPFLVNELATLERDPQQQSARAAYGTHDDRFMAMGFAVFTLEPPDQRSQSFRRQPATFVPTPAAAAAGRVRTGAYPVWQPSIQAHDSNAAAQLPIHRNHRGVSRLGSYRNNQMPRGYR